MRKAWKLALAALALGCGACSGGEAPRTVPADAPHVVVILADDLGWKDVGYQDSEIATPRIDALAAEGVVLTRFYAQPICTPARAALFTGRHPMRYGMIQNIRPESTDGLPLDERTLPQELSRAGYRSVLVGKWHQGHGAPNQAPGARGFDHFYGHLSGYIDYYSHLRDGVLDWQRNGEALVENGYSTRLIAQEAEQVLARHPADTPLFLVVSFNAPHIPLQLAPKRELEGATKAEQDRRCFAGMVEELDDAVGRVLDALRERGMERDTLVLFASDNGGSRTHGADNGVLRQGKYTTFEGGVRVPAVVRWPAELEGGRSVDEVLSILDVFPTVTRLAGVDVARDLDGVDLLPALRGDEVGERELAFAVRRRVGYRFGLVGARWKLVQEVRKEGGTENLLFDLARDPGEQQDLSARNPEVLAGMLQRLERFKERHPTRPWER